MAKKSKSAETKKAELTEDRNHVPSLSQAFTLAKERLLTSTARDWPPVSASFAHQTRVRGGGRIWVLECGVKLDGARFHTWVTMWSGNPAMAKENHERPPLAPALRRFLERTQRRLRARRLSGRFCVRWDHCPGSFGRFSSRSLPLERAIEDLRRFEVSMGAVAGRG
jgi:hypothetical protein